MHHRGERELADAASGDARPACARRARPSVNSTSRNCARCRARGGVHWGRQRRGRARTHRCGHDRDTDRRASWPDAPGAIDAVARPAVVFRKPSMRARSNAAHAGKRTCAPGDFRCLTRISPEQVVAAAERAIGSMMSGADHSGPRGEPEKLVPHREGQLHHMTTATMSMTHPRAVPGLERVTVALLLCFVASLQISIARRTSSWR